MSAAVTVRYFTDPGCPPDPAALRLRWLYSDQLAWELRMIVVRPDRRDPWPQREHDSTIHACRAVVATGLRWPDRRNAFLRRLTVLSALGQMLDDSDTLELAGEQAGLPVRRLAAYCAEPEVEVALRADMEAAAGRRCGEIDADDLAHLARRDGPESAEEVLRWAAMPLTTAEVNAVCARDVEAELERVARRHGEFWIPA